MTRITGNHQQKPVHHFAQNDQTKTRNTDTDLFAKDLYNQYSRLSFVHGRFQRKNRMEKAVNKFALYTKVKKDSAYNPPRFSYSIMNVVLSSDLQFTASHAALFWSATVHGFMCG